MNNEHKHINRIGAFLPIFFILTPILTGLKTYACLEISDASGHYGGSPWSVIPNVIVAVLLLIFFTHAFSHNRKDSTPIESFQNFPTYISSGILATSIAFIVYDLIVLIPTDFWTKPLATREDFIAAMPVGIIPLTAAVLGISAIISLFLNTIIEKKYSSIKSAFSILTVVFFAAYCVHVYFDNTVAINAQQKILTSLSLIFTAAFFLYEARINLGSSKWHSYAAFGLVSATSLIYTSIPALVRYFVKSELLPGASVPQLIMLVTSAIYVTVRITLISTAPDDEICDLADGILDSAYRREENRSLARVNNLKEENEAETE